MRNSIFDGSSFVGRFGDVRLAKTAALMFSRVVNLGSEIIRRLATGRSEQVRFNRFLWNKAVTIDEIKKAVFEKTAANASDCEHVLAIQDTTEVNLGHLDNQRLRGLGDVGNGARQTIRRSLGSCKPKKQSTNPCSRSLSFVSPKSRKLWT